AVTVGADGARVAFLRSRGPEHPTDALYVFDVAAGVERLVVDPIEVLRARAAAGDGVEPTAAERALRERTRLSGEGIGTFATDPKATVAAFTLGGGLYRADLVTGEVTACAAAAAAIDPRPDPTGQKIAYVSTGSGDGALRITSARSNDAGVDTLIA